MPIIPQTQHDWTVHSINIHRVFFERWCQQAVADAKGWTLDAVNYPVEFPPPSGPLRGKESALDIRASRGQSDDRLCLLIECKKNIQSSWTGSSSQNSVRPCLNKAILQAQQ